MIKLDIGGGTNPREGFLNIDQLPSADVQIDFESENLRLPYDNDSVEQVYSSHCFEHIANYPTLLHEIVRVCRLGASVEIRVPHWASSMAHCNGHRHALGEVQIQQWEEFKLVWWMGSAKRLHLVQTEYIPSKHFAEAQRLFPQMTDQQVMRFVQDACFELRYHFQVVAND